VIITDFIQKIISANKLTDQEIQLVFQEMLHGELADSEVEKILQAWHVQGETAQQLYIGASLLRSESVRPFSFKPSGVLADNCGTGGSGYAKFNISTTSALVAASQGVCIAKHGNKSASGRCGSADLLFRAGYPEKISDESLNDLLEKFGFCFLYAPNFHPILKRLAPIRKRMGIRTIFNLLGPLVNPMQPQVQLLGVSGNKYLKPMSQCLQRLGIEKALVVCSRDGLDEISPADITEGFLVTKDEVKPMTIDPSLYQMKASLKTIEGGGVDINFKLFMETLEGRSASAFEAVSLNAGALLWLSGVCGDLKSGIDLAAQGLKDGSVLQYFERWIARANH